MECFSPPVAAALLLATIFMLMKARGKPRNLPPSPKGAFPLIGHLHLLGKLPHQSLLKLANEYGGLMYLKFGTVGTLVVSTAEYAKEVLKTHDLVFASRPILQASTVFGYNGANFLWAPYGEFWRSMRKLSTMEILTSKRIEQLRPHRKLEKEVLVSLVLEACRKRIPVNLSNMIMDCTFNTVARTLMSSSYSRACNEAERRSAKGFKDNLTQAIKTVSNIQIGDIFPSLGFLNVPHMLQMKRLKARLDYYLESVLQQHRSNWKPGQEPKDFVDVMLANGLNDDTIKGQAGDMTVAGMDTMAVAVEWALAELIRHPDAMSLAQQELDQVVGKERGLEEDDISKLKYLQAVIKETLRLHPPGPLMLPHESMEDCVVGGYFVPAKSRVFINVYAIGRDPAVWKSPHKFDPERFLKGTGASIDVKGQNYELLPFGSGRRMCPGMTWGLTMVHVLLGTLLHGFHWSPADGLPAEELDMTEEFGIVTPRKTPLVLLASPRLHCFK